MSESINNLVLGDSTRKNVFKLNALINAFNDYMENGGAAAVDNITLRTLTIDGHEVTAVNSEYVTLSQYETLENGQTVTLSDDRIISYDANCIYYITDDNDSEGSGASGVSYDSITDTDITVYAEGMTADGDVPKLQYVLSTSMINGPQSTIAGSKHICAVTYISSTSIHINVCDLSTGNTYFKIKTSEGWGSWISTSGGGDSNNLLDNPDFKINQLGLSTYTNTSQTVDRWHMGQSSGILNICDDHITWTSEDTSYCNLIQRLATNVPIGETITLSATVEDFSGASLILGVNGLYYTTTANSNTKQRISVTAQITSQDYQTVCIQTSNASIRKIYNIKLEYGGVATAFIQPNYAEEILKIQSMDDDGASKLFTTPIMLSDMVSNPNLLINPNFKINQACQYTYGISRDTEGYPLTTDTVDKWSAWMFETFQTGVFTVNVIDTGVTITNGGDSFAAISQNIENYTLYTGKLMTMSACEMNGTVHKLSFTPNNESTMQVCRYYTSWGLLQVESCDDFTRIEIVVNSGSSVNLSWIKVELGATATQFEHPNASLELIKCNNGASVSITDADTLDGMHASEFYNNNLGTIPDLDTAITSGDGVYLDTSNQLGVIAGSLWTVHNSRPMFNGAVSIVQDVICTYPSGTGIHKMRTYYVIVDGWSEWFTFANRAASESVPGYVTTDAQTFAGAKTFNNGLNVIGHITATGSLLGYDSAGNARTVAGLNTETDAYRYAVGAYANTIQLGSEFTTATTIYGTALRYTTGSSTYDIVTTKNVASATASGIITTGSQTFAGEKTFANILYCNSNICLDNMKVIAMKDVSGTYRSILWRDTDGALRVGANSNIAGVQVGVAGIPVSILASDVSIQGTVSITGSCAVSANNSYTTPLVRNITMSTLSPTGGGNGQIHFTYTA